MGGGQGSGRAHSDEGDFVIEHVRRLPVIEVKWADRPGERHATGLPTFLDDDPNAADGRVVHRGHNVIRLAERIVSVP